MNQRLQLVAMFLLALASFGSVALAWKTLAASQALAEQSQASNAELLKELKGLVARLPMTSPLSPAPVPSVEWNRVRIRCVAEKEGGKPLAGVAVSFGGDKRILTNAEGVADLGLLHVGHNHLTFTIGERLQRTQTIDVRPGEIFDETVVCPPTDAQISVSMPMALPNGIPAELKSKIWCRVVIQRDSGGFDFWSETSSEDNALPMTVFLAPDGKIWPVLDANTQLRQQYYQESETHQPVEITSRPETGVFARFAASRIELSKELKPVEALQLPQGRYLVSCILAISDDRDPHALYLLPYELTLATLTLDGLPGLAPPDLSSPGPGTVKLAGSWKFSASKKHQQWYDAQWPGTNTWPVQVPQRELENIQFLTAFSADAMPTALISAAYSGKKVPVLGASDRIDFLLEDKVVLSGVPVFTHQVRSAGSDAVMYLFSSLKSREVELFRQIQQRSWGTPVEQRFKIRLRPGTADEQRGILPADFEEQLKNLPRPPNEST